MVELLAHFLDCAFGERHEKHHSLQVGHRGSLEYLSDILVVAICEPK